MLYYLAGPMTGYPKHNFDRFEEMTKRLRDLGLEILSAHEVDFGETEETRGSKPHGEYVREDLKRLLVCDAIILLEGWHGSVGASLEYMVALRADMTIYEACLHGDECPDLIHRVYPLSASNTYPF